MRILGNNGRSFGSKQPNSVISRALPATKNLSFAFSQANGSPVKTDTKKEATEKEGAVKKNLGYIRSQMSDAALMAVGTQALMSLGVTLAGGNILPNKYGNPEANISSTGISIAKIIPTLAIPIMLGANGTAATIRCMGGRSIYFPIAILQGLTGLYLDNPLGEIGRRIRSLRQLDVVIQKVLNNQSLNGEDERVVSQMTLGKNAILDQLSANTLMRGAKTITQEERQMLEVLHNRLEHEIYSMTEKGAKLNEKRGLWGLVYSTLMTVTWISVLFEFLTGRTGRYKEYAFKEQFPGLIEAGFTDKDIKKLEGEYNRPIYKNMGDAMKNGNMFRTWKRNIKEEVKSIPKAGKEFMEVLKNPSSLVDAFKDKDIDVKKKKEELAMELKKPKLNKMEDVFCALSAGPIGTMIEFLNCVARVFAFALSLGGLLTFGRLSFYNKHTPYYTKEQQQQDESDMKKHPIAALSFKVGEGLLASGRWFSGICNLLQAFSPGHLKYFGGPFWMVTMLLSSISYLSSGFVGLFSAVGGQALTILGTLFNVLAQSGGGVVKSWMQGKEKAEKGGGKSRVEKLLEENNHDVEKLLEKYKTPKSQEIREKIKPAEELKPEKIREAA